MKKMPRHIRLLLDEMDVLLEKHEQALLAKDLETARKYGEQLYFFTERHYKTLNLSEEYMNQVRQNRNKADKSYRESQISAAEAKKSRLEYEEAKQKYEKHLLEIPPEGKDRTAH